MSLRQSVAVLIAILLFSSNVFAQIHDLQGIVVDSGSFEPIPGARVTLKPLKLGAITKIDGHFSIPNVPAGKYDLVISSLGYEVKTLTVEIPIAAGDSILIATTLTAKAEEEEVVISGTRTVRSISDVPVRVEAIPQEEVEEKLMMRPASVAMLLNESAGIRVQNTSGTSNTSNVRIQGLDGRYTQILIDGIPSFSGMAAGFGITQLIPLNLWQVEIVKGASSGLYGPDAIAGVVNFITKEPKEEPELTGIVNVTSQKGFDASAYFGQQFHPVGVTALVSYDRQSRFDVNGDNFSDLAEYTRLTFSPKIEYELSSDVLLKATMSYFHEDRLGGIMTGSESDVGIVAPYLESNKTDRWNYATSIDWKIDESSSVTLRGAGMQLERDSYYGAIPFNGTQHFYLGDAIYTLGIDHHALLFGAAMTSESFDDRTPNIPEVRSYEYGDIGAWAQDEISIGERWKILLSSRFDKHNVYGSFFTPRASVLFKALPTLSFRVGGGTGFKAPTIFLEDAELYGFRNARPIRNAKAEEAKSVSFDINYRAIVGDIAAQFNFALYSTWLDHALLINDDSLRQDIIYLQNATGPTTAKGAEFSTQLSYEVFKLSIGYAYLYTQQNDRGTSYELELNPRHWLGIVLTYENSDAGVKAGIENYFTSSQHLSDDPYRTVTPSYWLNGFMIEKAFGPIRLFLNAEDLFDVRQTRFEIPYLGNPARGDFRPLHFWAPIEGRSFNGGVRFVL